MQDIEQALTDVRKSYRLLAEYQRTILDLVVKCRELMVRI